MIVPGTGIHLSNMLGEFDLNVWVMDADGNNPMFLVEGGLEPQWAPDSSHMGIRKTLIMA